MDQFERYLRIEDEYDVRSTLFVGGSPATPLLSEEGGCRIPEPQYSLSATVSFEESQTTVAALFETLSERG